MSIQRILEARHITRYHLSKISNVPYTTITDICNGKTKLEKCSAGTVFKLSKALDIPMDDLLQSCLEVSTDFEIFKSNVCHRVREMGVIQFIMHILQNDIIRSLFNDKEYAESLYLLAMLDYLSRINSVPLCTSYNDLRRCKLKETIYPRSILIAYAVQHHEEIKEKAYHDSIPEFARFNIIESEVRNVI